jgi:hypothetical protein
MLMVKDRGFRVYGLYFDGFPDLFLGLWFGVYGQGIRFMVYSFAVYGVRLMIKGCRVWN